MQPELNAPRLPTAGIRRLSGRFGHTGWMLGIVAAVTAGLLIARLLLAGGASPPAGGETVSYVNQQGGYALRYPADWTATSMGSATKLTSATKDVVVGIGEAPTGALVKASERFTTAVLRSYKGVRVERPTIQRIGGRRSALVAGSATNLSGIAIRWLTITIVDRGKNFGISVFTSAGSDPAEVLPKLHRLVESFRALS